MANSGDVVKALVAVLANDPTLQALLPDGVYFDVAAQGAQQFAVIGLTGHVDLLVFGGRDEEFRFYILAVGLSTTPDDGVDAAAERIHALLDRQVLTVPGYKVNTVYRSGYEDKRAVDPVNASVRWQQRGGAYVVRAEAVS